MKLDRKDFLKSALIVAGATVGLTEIGACGGDDSTGGTGGASGSGGSSGTGGGSAANACATHEPVETIAANHGHVLTVSMADAAAGAAKTYDITGTANHAHMVAITADMFTMLQAGMTVSTTSSTDGGHSHVITVVCA